MRTHFLLAALLLGAAPVVAAQHPDLSGTWVAAPQIAPAGLVAPPSPVFGARFQMKTESAGLRIVRPAGEVSMETSLALDGSRGTTAMAAPACMAERTLHETAAWAGDTLVLTAVGITPAGGGATPEIANRTLFRQLSADQLLVEGTMVRQGQRLRVGTVYTRSADALPPLRAPLPTAGTPATIDRAAWIGATWAGTANGITTEERWTPAASGTMMATARTLRGSALTGFEFLCITERSGRLVYVAMPNARTPGTIFVATDVTATSVTFENPTHDFPKVIRYAQTADGGLETTISDAGGARAQKVVLRKVAATP